MRGLTDAVTFLTVIPVPRLVADDGLDLGRALPWFPVVGAAVGAAGGGVRVALSSPLGPGPSSALAMAAMVLITGALHQDALADACDGLGDRGDRARRLAVMRDSTVGAFGVLAIVLWGLTEFAALDALTAQRALRVLIAAGATSRLAVLVHGRLTPPARPDGLGATLGATTPGRSWLPCRRSWRAQPPSVPPAAGWPSVWAPRSPGSQPWAPGAPSAVAPAIRSERRWRSSRPPYASRFSPRGDGWVTRPFGGYTGGIPRMRA